MAEGEGHEDKEDLFEDLDKFFAPIQDVDWPETAEPPAPAVPPTREPEPPEQPSEPEHLEEEPEVVVREGYPSAEEAPVTEDLFAAQPAERPTEPPEGPPEEAEAAEEPSEEEGIEAFLFGEVSEGELDIGEAIHVERLAHPPEEYVALPRPSEEVEEPAVAEAIEEEPSAEEIEAAAEHFAESVREDVVVEAEEEVEIAGYDTQPEAGIEELLGAPEEEGGPVGGEPEIPVRTVRVGAEDLGGPSWQEPTSVEVGPDVARGGPGRNVQLAFLTGIVLGALAIGAIAIGAGVFAVLAGIVVLVAQGEFYFALQKRHYQPATALGLVTGALVLGAGYYRGEPAALAMTALGTIATFLWYMTVPAQHRRNVVSNIGLTVLGVVWIPMFASYLLVLLTELEDGRALVLAILGLAIAYDASAFAVGYFWGSRPLAPSISPKKSWEGAIGATLVVIAAAVGVVAPAVDLLDTIPRAVGLAVVVALFAPFGDLAESLVKRDLGIKDMGSILPGHGGILDRVDGMLFVVPAAALYLRLILA